jgi:hypothetical protein
VTYLFIDIRFFQAEVSHEYKIANGKNRAKQGSGTDSILTIYRPLYIPLS